MQGESWAIGRHSQSFQRLAGLLLAAVLCGCSTIGHQPPQPPDYHYANGRFRNVGSTDDPLRHKGRLVREAVKIKLGFYPRAAELPDGHVLDEAATRDGLLRSARSDVALTWIGHSTALIRIADKWVLTDPAMSRSVGFGPFRVNRLVPPRPSLEELPKIDVIVISHADHDHLDLRTLRNLARRNLNSTVYVPLRNGPLVRAAGFQDVRELDWYDRDRLGDLELIAVPAVHGVRRPPLQINATLWAGWVLKHGGSSIYFAGDTGFGDIFTDIRRTVGPVDVALVPIGAYSPRSMQQDVHANPEEAAEIARVMGARIAVGVHWGTFPLSGEPPTEQRSRFLAAGGRGVSTRLLRVGETLVLR